MSLESFKTRVLPVKDKLFRYTLRILKNEDEAKDVVQETFIKVWNKRDEMDKLENMEAWCVRVARNLALDKLKSKHNNSVDIDNAYDLQTSNQSPYSSAEQSDTMRSIHHFINQLPDMQKQIIQLRDIDGFSYQEISDILKQNLNTVKVNLFRARKQVREQLIQVNAYGL
ncbi:RNA polymerase ECF-type sigma factor [hydrothermal vent metagenome]|uniref:RNA polymerase ECF-type sigma factor n=1 Tax=hydrothermal vent metagenome TaxID=652676 RepID=A0A3B0U960_9ZZZZ